MTTIVIGGDVCPTGRIQKTFIEGNADGIFHDLLVEIVSADLSIVNLECPLVSQETPIEKAGGFVLGASVDAINGFIASKWTILNIANNHSFDHGAQGLLETIRTIQKPGLACIGAGSDIEEARQPFIKEIKGERIVVYAMAEREYSIADERTAGANPLDIINFVNVIRQYKKDGIFIALIHGGKEFYSYPSPELVRKCRFIVDMGADAVICCHTHCPLPWEIYAGRPIIYGLGNLIFEPLRQPPNSWYEGYLAKLIFQNGQVGLDVIPYIQSQTLPGAQKMDKTLSKKFIEELGRKSDQLKDALFLETQWEKYCGQLKESYLDVLLGDNYFMRRARRFLHKRLYSKKRIHQALLLVQCETHQEILNTIFRDERRER
jgi:poly-gamma-glutamate synthesis protein (capsule biosynthesis protein)